MKKLLIVSIILLSSFIRYDDSTQGIEIKLVDKITGYPVDCRLEGLNIYKTSSDKCLRVTASKINTDMGTYILKFTSPISNDMYEMPDELIGSKTLKEFSPLSNTYVLNYNPDYLNNHLPPGKVGSDGDEK